MIKKWLIVFFFSFFFFFFFSLIVIYLFIFLYIIIFFLFVCGGGGGGFLLICNFVHILTLQFHPVLVMSLEISPLHLTLHFTKECYLRGDPQIICQLDQGWSAS